MRKRWISRSKWCLAFQTTCFTTTVKCLYCQANLATIRFPFFLLNNRTQKKIAAAEPDFRNKVRKQIMDNLDHGRSRAWRRHQAKRPSHRVHGKNPFEGKPEKKWDLMYFRRNKVKRAQKLGFVYPFRQHEFEAEWFD